MWRKARRGKKVRVLDETGDFITGCPTYPFEIIRAATNGFSQENEIGRGGFGIVYKGQLPNGQEIAVKKLSKENTVQGLKEFMNEVDIIYESGRAMLSWKMRMDIILDIASGLQYLHKDSRHTIIHRDLKAANVLLDADMVAKISDFGIARLFSHNGGNQDCTITDRVVGTPGYMSPEYAMDGKLSFMQDVYSFGVLLLEIISGKHNQGTSSLIAHATTCIQVGLLCVQESPDQRPPMADVIHMLSWEKALGQPRRPVVCTPMRRSPAAVVDDLGVQQTTTCGHSGRLTITDLEAR
uniref:Protein kinase domain-containing protein n=1 Tax=Oryza glumipatula TaxID=40148 RepID=A0A0E0AIE5_9ORYZ